MSVAVALRALTAQVRDYYIQVMGLEPSIANMGPPILGNRPAPGSGFGGPGPGGPPGNFGPPGGPPRFGGGPPGGGGFGANAPGFVPPLGAPVRYQAGTPCLSRAPS